MTTVSSTSSSTAYTPTTSSTSTASSANNTSTASGTYDGAAAVAQAQTLAQQELSNGSSGATGGLLGLDSNILSLLQGSGGGFASTLLGGSGGNAFLAQQTYVALYGAAQKRFDDSLSSDPVSNLVASSNAAVNSANASTTDGSSTSAADTTSSDTATATDTNA